MPTKVFSFWTAELRGNEMKKWMRAIPLTGLALLFVGCGHLAYIGMHGRSIRSYPDIHESVSEDAQCLDCHHPDRAQGPATPHPTFTGCIKCHNDALH